MVKVLISGAFGFIGKPLVFFLKSEGIEIFSLLRKRSRGATFWDVELQDLEGFDAVIHLSGEPLGLGIWSAEKKRKILESRVEGTSKLVDLLLQTKAPPKVFVSASAVGFYGNRNEELLDESSSKGDGFLSDVCAAWENAASKLNPVSRVVCARFGMVLDRSGGALKKMLFFYRLGLGATLGSGLEWHSFIDLTDLIRAIYHIIKTDTLSGPVNVASPYFVRQEEFSKTLATLLKRPHFLKIPKKALQWLFKEAGDELLLASQKVKPTKLLESKFTFKYAEVKSSLERALFEGAEPTVKNE